MSLPRRSVWPDAALIPAATPSSFAVARFVSCSGSVALAARLVMPQSFDLMAILPSIHRVL